MDKMFVSNLVLAEKRRALSELVEYAGKNSVFISHDDNYALTDS
jgi:ABC-type sulfate/molybdate transport systems ATPase subunit